MMLQGKKVNKFLWKLSKSLTFPLGVGVDIRKRMSWTDYLRLLISRTVEILLKKNDA